MLGDEWVCGSVADALRVVRKRASWKLTSKRAINGTHSQKETLNCARKPLRALPSDSSERTETTFRERSLLVTNAGTFREESCPQREASAYI